MKKGTLNETGHRRVHKLLYRADINNQESLCHLCSPHKGCNSGFGKQYQRSWKKFRKKQWKN